MKKPVWLLLILVLSIWYSQSALMSSEVQPNQVMIQSGKCDVTDPAKPETNLFDNNSKTVWNTSALSGTKVKLVLKLAEKVFLDYMEFSGVAENNQTVSLEYSAQDGTWCPLIGCQKIPLLNGRIDLSLSGVKSGSLRLVFNSQGSNQKLAEIGEVKVYGDKTESVARLNTQITVSGRNASNPVGFLNDYNTYTVWQPQAGTVTLTLESASVVKKIKLYIQKSVGILNFTVWRNGEAVPLASKMDLSAVEEGWNTIELPGVLTDRIQINLTDVEKSCGGIGEVEVWGETIRDEVKIVPLGRSADGLRELGFNLTEVNPQTKVKLYFSLPEQSTNLKPRLNINGTPVDGIGSTIVSNGVTLGQIKCESNLLRQGNNLIVADFAAFSTCDTILAISQNQGILEAKITTPTSGESPSLGDGLKYTEISNLCDNTFELQLASAASVDWIRLVGPDIYDPTGVCVYIWENNAWNMVSPDLVSTEGDMIFIKGGTEPTEKVKLHLAKWISPSEIMVFGSEVNQTAPRITLTQPEGLTVNAGASLQVEGYVDNGEAAVTFNGTPLQLQEHFFSYPVFINSNDPTFNIEIIAIDRQGRKGVFRKTLAINHSPSAGLPILKCDLPDNYYTSNSHITVKGTASQANEVSVNSEPAEFQNAGGIYTRGVDLIEGENKVTITAKSASGAMVSLERRIIRDSQPPVIEILETTQNDGQLIIKGSCSDASPVELRVNGRKTVLSENTFTYTINLVNGKNLINIAAKDLAGNEASDEVAEVLEADAKLAVKSVSAAKDDGMDYTNIAAQYDAPGIIDTRITGPYGTWLANNRETVSPATGSLMISANDLSLPGRDGFDFELIRLYNSEKAQSDLIRSEVMLDTFGAGWTTNIPWVNKDTKQLHLPTGQIVKVDGTVWTSPGSKYECHEGVHFSLEYSSEKGYTLIVNDGAKYLFDTSGKLIDKISPNSQNTIHFSYRDREITEIIDSIGRKVKFTYKTVGSQRLIQSIETGSRVIEYDYDDHGLLKLVIDPVKRKTEYTYKYYGNKEVGTKYQNVTTKWERVIVGYTTRTYTDPITGEKWTEYVPIYDIELVTTYGPVVNKLKQYDLYLLETINYPTGLSSVYSYYHNTFLQNYDSDQKGFFRYRNERFPVKEQTIGARHIDYSYQMNPVYGDIIDRNLVLKNSYILSATVVETGGKTIKYNLRHVKKSSGSYSLTTYPTSGDYVGAVIESSQVGYDSKEFENVKYQYECSILEPTLEQHLRGDQEIYRITNDYDTWGNLTTQTDSRTGLKKEIIYLNHATVKDLPETVTVTNKNPVTGGDSQVTTTYKYHPTYIKPETITVDAGSKTIITNFSYYDNGNLKSKTNPNGLIEALEYDANNAYPAKKTFQGLKDADGKPVSDIVNQFGYDSYGRKQWEMDGRGYVTYYEYDDLNRVTAVYLPDDDDTPFVAPSKAPSGNPYREYKFDDTANTCEFWNENRQKTLYQFDRLGRLTGEVKYNDQSRYSATESKTVYHYDDLGRVDYVTDPNNHTTSYQYDGLSRLKKIIYPTETSAVDSSYAQLDYDDVSNTVTIRQENGNIVIHKKDWADRLIAATQQAVYGNEIQSYLWSFQYDSLGNKVEQTNPLSKITNYTFDPLGHLEKVQLPSDSLVAPGSISQETVKNPLELQPATICEYDEMGNKIKESDANGDQIEYEYDGLGRVSLVRKKVTRTHLSTKLKETVTALTKYYYDAGENKVKTSDPNGHAWLYDYSARGFLLQEEDPEGNRTQYRYDPLGKKIAVIDPRNTDASPKIWYSFSGDQLVLKDSRNDKTFTTWYLYDNYNRLYRTVMPDNTPPSNPFEATPGYDNPYTETWYDLAGNKETERDTTGQMTQYTYYPRNWLKTVEGPGKKEAYEYDATGNQTVTRIWTDIAGDASYSIIKQYDSLGRIRKVTYPESTEEYTCDPFGNRLTVKDGNGNLTEYKYNNYGWQTEVIDPLKKTTTYRYDPNGNKVATITAKNLCFISRYDEQNRVAESVDSLGVSTFYNYDAGGNLSGKLDPRKTTWQYVYNDNNTLKQLNLTGADQTTYSVNYTYDKAGNRMTVSDTGKINNIITYNDQLPDPMNRINAVERQFDGKTYRTEYEYNPAGQLKAIKYPEATEKINYQYNASGRLVEVTGFTQPAGITYDDDGLIKNIALANHINTQYGYNPSRRLQDLNVNQASNSLIKLSYIYDLAGNIKTINDQVSGKQSTFNYYENNWLKSENMIGKFTAEVKGENGGVPGHVEKDYQGDKILDFISPQGVVSLDYASSSIGLDFGELNIPTIKKIQLVPDNAHQTNRLIARSLEILTSPENVHYTLVPKTDWTFSKDDQGIITITLAKPIKSRLIKIHCLIDNRDTEGNSINKATFINELAQMIRVYEEIDGQKTCNYQYDNAGNRIYREVVLTNSVNSTAGSYVYYANSDRLLTDGEYAYAYDAAGNLIAKGNRFSFVGEKLEFTEKTGAGVEYWEYRYDLLNRLIEVGKNGEIIVNYGYDPEGLRVVKTNKSGTFHYVFEGTEPIFEKNISSGGVKSYVYALGKHLARVDGVIGDSVAKRYYYHTDQVCSIRNITDQQGNSVFNADYMAFGSQFGKEGSLNEQHGFTGKEYDPDTGLYYYNARWYDSELGRFVSEDSFEGDPNNPISLNRYTYGWNNPLVYTDPTGHLPEGVDWDDLQSEIDWYWTTDSNFYGNWWQNSNTLMQSLLYLQWDMEMNGSDSFIHSGGSYDPHQMQAIEAALGTKRDGIFDISDVNAVENVQTQYDMSKASPNTIGTRTMKALVDIAGKRADFYEKHPTLKFISNVYGDTGYCEDLYATAVFGAIASSAYYKGRYSADLDGDSSLNSKILFRGERSSMSPDKVFENGFSPKGTSIDLIQHTTSNTKAGNFVSTSSNFNIAQGFAGKNGYVYVIESSKYINVNQTLGSKSLYPEQMEFSIPGGVNSSQIRGAYVMKNGKLTGEFIPNPNYNGGK